MSDFDPKAYVAQVNAQPAFDPKAYADAVNGAGDGKFTDATVGPITTAAVHFARHGAFGLGDKITAAIAALMDHDKTGKTFGQKYDQNLAFNDQVMEASDQAHPVARWLGNLGGVGVNMAAMTMAPGAIATRAPVAARALGIGQQAAPEALTLGGRMLRGALEGAKVGGVTGAVGGYGAARGNEGLGTGIGTLAGVALGAPMGALGVPFAEWLAKRATPQVAALQDVEGLPLMAKQVHPTQEAQTLQRYGVPVTLGQMDPHSLANVVEEGALRVPFLDKAVGAQREAAEQGWRDAVINEARSPVEGPVGPGGAVEKAERIKGDFKQAYDEIADKFAGPAATHPETGEIVSPREALEGILKDVTYQAGNDDETIVRRIFENELSKIEKTQAAGQPIKAGLLQDMRSGLREAAQRARLQPGGHARAQMFQDAADSIGGGLRATLPADAVAKLNATDAAYSKFMRVTDAIYAARQNAEEGEFGPKQLSQALAKAYGKKLATNSEAGGSLRELSRAGKSVFTPRTPLNGHGDALKGKAGMALGEILRRANENPEAQSAFMQAAREAAANGGQPNMTPAVAGLWGRLAARGFSEVPFAPTASNEAGATLADLLSPRYGR